MECIGSVDKALDWLVIEGLLVLDSLLAETLCWVLSKTLYIPCLVLARSAMIRQKAYCDISQYGNPRIAMHIAIHLVSLFLSITSTSLVL